MSRQYESLIEDVAKQPSVAVSLILYLSSLADLIDFNRNNPAALHALAADIRDRRDNVVTAVLLNSTEGPEPVADFEPANGGDAAAAAEGADTPGADPVEVKVAGSEAEAEAEAVDGAAEPVDDVEAKAAAAAEAAERADKTGDNEFA